MRTTLNERTYLVSSAGPARIKSLRILEFFDRESSKKFVDFILDAPCFCVSELFLRLHGVEPPCTQETPVFTRNRQVLDTNTIICHSTSELTTA